MSIENKMNEHMFLNTRGTLNKHPKEIKVMLHKITYLCDEVLFVVVIKV